MTSETKQAMRELAAIIDGKHSYRLGSVELDHSTGTTFINCVNGDSKKPIYRFEIEHISEKGLRLLNDEISPDWGARLMLEQDFDAEGNPVNAIIEDNSGVSLTCSVIYVDVYDDNRPTVGYAHASGTPPYDLYSEPLLTIGNYCYSIHVNRVDYFFEFVGKNVVVVLNENNITLKPGDGKSKVDAIILEVCDAVDPEDADLTKSQCDELYDAIAKTSPIMRLKQ